MDPPSCKHAEEPVCTETCECWCDSCQAQYEVTWHKRAAEQKLCDYCGMPTVMSLQSLTDFQYVHFFMPCDDCKPPFEEFMALHKLCTLCRTGLREDGACPACTCNKKEDCSCRECSAKKGS